ncbi:MAG TPA: heavy metal translocating P-type ATPase [Mycobacteriales bacterium]|nr:heavy metal translocating P-type ATPase [Mycobacteriales bacterium]
MAGSSGRRPSVRARFIRSSFDLFFLVFTTGALAGGGALWLLGMRSPADAAWAAGTLAAAGPALYWVIDALRHRRLGVDLIAVLALGGSLAVEQYFAGGLIALMLATGKFLDSTAQRRATHDLRALLQRVPQSARRRAGDAITIVPLADIGPDDLVLVGPGEMVGVDGRLESDSAALDESALTGEAEWVHRGRGEVVRSGVVNAGDALEMRAIATAQDSTYAGVVRLAQQADAQGAPLVRLADRLAAWFLPATLAVATAAGAAAGSLERAVAVLVVATPCPLLLAAPVAVVSGLSRASRYGVIIRDGAALEQLGHARTLLLDKTGTVTSGRPTVLRIATAPEARADEVLRLAASVEQVSSHVLAEAVVREARSRRLELAPPQRVKEIPGRGVSGVVEGISVTVGRSSDAGVPAWAAGSLRQAVLDSAAVVWVLVENRPYGLILLRDQLRVDAPRTIRRLRAAGLRRVLLVTGDKVEPALEVATTLGLDGALAEQTPQQKVDAVRRESQSAVTLMVGDGINDAPALASASVGVAMGARGAGASSEAADIVLTTDRLEHLADAMVIARRARRIAWQSAGIGMGLSLVAMAVAAFGFLPPAPGAILQEAIDLAVIGNALRSLRPGRTETVDMPPATADLLHRFAIEHQRLRDSLPLIHEAADLLRIGSPEALPMLNRARRFLTEDVLPHERAEEHLLYPALAVPLGSSEVTSTMSRTHAEIEHLIARLNRQLDSAGGRLPSEEQIDDLLACLYGLHTLLYLHFTQEEESYFVLSPRGVPEHETASAHHD